MEMILVMWLIFAGLVGFLADARGRSGPGYFLLAAVLSPVVGLIVVLCTRNLKQQEEEDQQRKKDHELQVESIRAIAGNGKPTVADELEKLAGLRDRGVLSQGEFDSQKAAILARH